VKRTMRNLTVETSSDGSVHLSQELHDPNFDDPIIEISSDQAAIVATWILEAGREARDEIGIDNDSIPVSLYQGDPGPDHYELSVFGNSRGMIVMRFTDDLFVEISPAMAKRLRERLSDAIRGSLTDMLRPDKDV
jgi:hypothetical protein